VVFDLDQTLVDFISVHDEATRELFRTSFGVDARLTEIDFAGRSLADNFQELARLKGIGSLRQGANMQAVVDRYERIFAAKIPEDASRHVLPGVRRLLEELSRTENLIALYTGDSRGVAEPVLAATGLERYFMFSVYGTDAGTRVDMVRVAIRKAREHTGREFRDGDVVIVGDSVRDVECGRQLDAVTVAVATGFHSPRQLSDAGADYVFPDLQECDRVLAAIA